jgi:hypothetical protein
VLWPCCSLCPNCTTCRRCCWPRLTWVPRRQHRKCSLCLCWSCCASRGWLCHASHGCHNTSELQRWPPTLEQRGWQPPSPEEGRGRLRHAVSHHRTTVEGRRAGHRLGGQSREETRASGVVEAKYPPTATLGVAPPPRPAGHTALHRLGRRMERECVREGGVLALSDGSRGWGWEVRETGDPSEVF